MHWNQCRMMKSAIPFNILPFEPNFVLLSPSNTLHSKVAIPLLAMISLLVNVFLMQHLMLLWWWMLWWINCVINVLDERIRTIYCTCVELVSLPDIVRPIVWMQLHRYILWNVMLSTGWWLCYCVSGEQVSLTSHPSQSDSMPSPKKARRLLFVYWFGSCTTNTKKKNPQKTHHLHDLQWKTSSKTSWNPFPMPLVHSSSAMWWIWSIMRTSFLLSLKPQLWCRYCKWRRWSTLKHGCHPMLELQFCFASKYDEHQLHCITHINVTR